MQFVNSVHFIDVKTSKASLTLASEWNLQVRIPAVLEQEEQQILLEAPAQEPGTLSPDFCGPNLGYKRFASARDEKTS